MNIGASKNICFVIMGFGTKTDLSTGKSIDLDKTYKNIIQPAAERSGYQCVRADEIQDSSLIDKSMYALLMHADLVIADISTYNPNALYELGVRHAVRPFSTIILKEKEGKIPFDLDHTRIFPYEHLGIDIGADEAARCQKDLSELIDSITRNNFIDSPLYDYIKDVIPPKIAPAEYDRIIGDLAARETHIFAIAEKAKSNMKNSQFPDAAKLWEKASSMVPNEPYFIQQHALAVYKSEEPSKLSALSDALKIIETLDPDGESNDPETLGLTGAIYKRLWFVSCDREYLKRAIQYYGKGFQLKNDYYTGENYALCLDIMASIEKDPDEKAYNLVAAKKARKRILEILSDIITDEADIISEDSKWAYATIANCYFALGDEDSANKYESKFYETTDVEWERATYEDSKSKILKLMKGQ